MTDSSGYGQSLKPRGSGSHEEYSKKEMAADQGQVMRVSDLDHSPPCCHTSAYIGRKHFGFYSFFLVGHDRGARVSHRLALDYPETVKKLIIVNILPTLWMYEHTNMDFVRHISSN